MIKKYFKNKKGRSGMVLLYALLVASVVLVIGLTLSNIIVKQLIISSISKEMNQAYYAANTGRECMNFLYRIQTQFLSDPPPAIAALHYQCDGNDPGIGNIGGTLNDLANPLVINYDRPAGPVGVSAKSCTLISVINQDAPQDKEFKESVIQGYNANCEVNPPTPNVNGRTVERVVCIDFAGGSSSCTGTD